MIKIMIMMTLCIFISHNQSIQVQKQLTCDCNEILNEKECQSKFDCQWIINQNTKPDLMNIEYICTKSTHQYDAKFSRCYLIESIYDCAKTIGCAYYNKTCQIFSGCTAYAEQTNLACQSISSQCTTNYINCINIQQCKFYQMEQLCKENAAIYGMNKCQWVDGKCIDKKCSDYPSQLPTQLPTQLECSSWLPYCSSNGLECVEQLKYCHEYKKTFGCKGLIGKDGDCIVDIQTKECRSVQCDDAPVSYSTNQKCEKFIYGQNCITNGNGCTQVLKNCNNYQGTKKVCFQYIGSDGKCDGGLDNKEVACFQRQCFFASQSLTDDQQCDDYLQGCITNGYGCVIQLLLCNQYQTKTDLCIKLIGLDGNCIYDSKQSSNDRCSAKQCQDAPQSYKTNKQCSEYSFNCQTNGQGCILQQSCNIEKEKTQCLGNDNCAFINQCVDKTDCRNYISQLECQLNQQNYKIFDGTFYIRNCIWKDYECQNQVCSSFEGTTDLQCEQKLSGCLTNGYQCIDIVDPCSSYKGNSQQCQKFRGLKGSQQCTQYVSVIDQNTACLDKACNLAKNTMNLIISSNIICEQYLSSCKFDGLDNCTQGDCSTYYGTQESCSLITAINQFGILEKCWKNYDILYSKTQCQSRKCDDAPKTIKTDIECINYLKECKYNGQGGCIDKEQQINCKNFIGSKAQCQAQNKDCSKLQNFCKVKDCRFNNIPQELTTYEDKQAYCEQFKNHSGIQCTMYPGGERCDGSSNCHYFVAKGSDIRAKQLYCQNLRVFINTINCGYQTGDKCSSVICSQIITPLISDKSNILYCNSYFNCGYKGGSTCSDKSCQDQGLIDSNSCTNYMANCSYSQKINLCYDIGKVCSEFNIPLQNQNSFQQSLTYCQEIQTQVNGYCTYNKQTPETCSQIFNCQQIEIDSSLNFLLERVSYCSQIKDHQGKFCGYTIYATYCISGVVCSDNQIITNNLIGQQACQMLRNYQGEVCNYKSGELNCSNPESSCQDYQTFGNDYQTNRQLCQKLYDTSIIPRQCDYSQGQNCSNLICSNVQNPTSVQDCQAYSFNCIFDGESCVEKQNDCQLYSVSKEYCSQMILADGSLCGQKNEDSTCKSRQCEQITQNADAQICDQYLKGCQFNGQGCVQKELNCQNYIPFGYNDTIKAQICNQMIGVNNNCTFISGNNCINRALICNYYIASLSNPSQVCSLAKQQDGNYCMWEYGDTCRERNCYISPNEDCENYYSFQNFPYCKIDETSQCDYLNYCERAPSIFTSNLQCQQYHPDCVTNGAGCLENSASCNSYKGDKKTCENFRGSNGTILCTNYDSKINSCIDRTCQLNTTALNDYQCNIWIPKTDKIQCVWNGSFGCFDSTVYCSNFKGTIDSCPLFTAIDGPCSGTTVSQQTCISNQWNCIDAPNYFKSDQQCQTWHRTCITNGFGCISISDHNCSKILSVTACKQSQLGCGIIKSCKSKQKKCQFYYSIQECINTPLLDQTIPNCVWDSQKNQCSEIICSMLPFTLTTHIACNKYLSSCTTTGSGCVTMGSCSSYSKQACNIALSTDQQKYCIWENSSCRPIICSDNKTAKTDYECNQYLSGCRTIRNGCSDSFSCSQFTESQFCLTDSYNYPCLWFNQKCMAFSKCEDYYEQTHIVCQQLSNQCTTNGINCIPINQCKLYTLSNSCIIGIDGICGWQPQFNDKQPKCSLFTKCSDSQGKTLDDCQLWGKNCVSDGLNCIDKQFCQYYTNQLACFNQGVDGRCKWIQESLKCKLEECGDYNINNHKDCYSLSNKCTTNGSDCIAINLCQDYTQQISCHIGQDGPCFWNNLTCRLETCEDYKYPTLEQCQKISNVTKKCVSNGINCIQQQKCSQYTNYESCLGGGTDGACAFQSQNKGICVPFLQCSDANYDKIACNRREDSCYYTQTVNNQLITNSTISQTVESCQNHTCSTKSIGTICQAIPSFDLKSYQICILFENQCVSGNTQLLDSQNCFNSSFGTYTWNPQLQKCNSCKKIDSMIHSEQSVIWSSLIQITILNLIV